MASLVQKVKHLNIKKVIKGFTLLWGLLLIVIMTVVNAVIDPEQLNIFTWLSNTLILVGIMVFGLLMGESIGIDRQIEMIDGLYQRNLKEYNEKNKMIEVIIIYFSQFFYWFKKRELFDKKVDYLINHDVDGEMVENIVKYIKIEHLFELKEHAIHLKDKDGNDIFIEKQGEEQIKAIEEVLSGKIKVDCPNSSYFLNAFENSSSTSVLEEGKQIDKEIKLNRRFNRGMKIAISVFISLIFSMLTVKDFMDAGSAQAWMNLISRITALFTSLCSGWMSGVVEAKLRAKKIKNKYIVLVQFENAFNTKQFIPESGNELAKKHYEEFIAEKERKEQEALNNVVTPEVVNEPPRLEDKTIYMGENTK